MVNVYLDYSFIHVLFVYRSAQLKVALQAWKVGTTISKTERKEDMRVAEICWSRTTLRSHFTAWRDTLLTNKACRMCDSNLTRYAHCQQFLYGKIYILVLLCKISDPCLV